MAQLAPIPPPGLAILPQYISPQPTTLTLKSSWPSRTMTATDPTNTLLFTITSEKLSRSHRHTILDAFSQPVFQVRKATLGTAHYYAETSENGPRLFETDTERKLLHRSRTQVTFVNAADGARQVVGLEYVPPGLREDGALFLGSGGRQIVRVEKVGIGMSGEYRVWIAPGLDVSLVVGVVVAGIDQARTRAGAGAASAGVAGGVGS